MCIYVHKIKYWIYYYLVMLFEDKTSNILDILVEN